MSPESQRLESFFAPLGQQPASDADSGSEESAEEDLTRFFERLSSLDDMPWFSPTDPVEGGEIPVASGATSAAVRRAEGQAPAPPAQPVPTAAPSNATTVPLPQQPATTVDPSTAAPSPHPARTQPAPSSRTRNNTTESP